MWREGGKEGKENRRLLVHRWESSAEEERNKNLTYWKTCEIDNIAIKQKLGVVYTEVYLSTSPLVRSLVKIAAD